MLSLLPFHLRKKKWYRAVLFWYYVVVNSLLVVAINLSDAVYFRYTQKRFTADDIFFAENSNSLQLVGKFMVENWYLLFVAALLIALLVWGYGRKVREESILRRGAVYYIFGTVILGIGIGLSIAGVRGGFTRMVRPITLSNATLYTTDTNKANLILSNPFAILRTIGSSGTIKYKKYFSDEELPTYFTPDHYPADSTAINLSGRNVVIFIMESMSAEHSAYLKPELYADKETKGYTPFLDSLMRYGFCFKQMYANGTRSIQAMPSILGSIPSFKTPFVLMPQSLGESRQLPAMLRGKGYSTTFFCGSDNGSMGFGAYARSAGMERLVSLEDYEKKHGKGDFDGYWGIWDEPFMQFMGEELSEMPQPFFASLFTLSSHHPFVVPPQYENKLPKGETKVHKPVAYSDYAFRRFFERFGQEEWYKNTIFVFVADHVSSEKYAPETHIYPENMHIIGFIYTPDGALCGEVDDVVQQLDIMPTILGLLDNKEPYFAFGRDIFNEPQRPHWSVNWEEKYRAITNDYLLDINETGSNAAARCATTQENADELLQRFRGVIQQYYTHIEKKSYVVRN
jgi:phosphoglycerol transferase MdoB-like AlkP superfamily enzyme